MLIRSAPGGHEPRSPELRRRLVWLLAVMAVSFTALVVRLWQLQIVRGNEYFEAARSNVVDERFLPSVRGKVVDRNGVALADNRPAFNIYVVPRLFDAAARARLIDLLGLDGEEVTRLDQRLATARKRRSTRAVMVLEDQGRDRAGLVAQARPELGGAVQVHDEPYRTYPFGTLAAHLVGFMNQPSSQEMADLEKQGYDATEFVGRYGVERGWESYLHGKKGIERFIINASGDRIDDAEAEKLIEGARFEPPIAGHDVVLTIDLELQRLAEHAVGAHPAAAVAVVEVETGRMLALVSTPSFDPNVMTGHLTRVEHERLQGDPRHPYVDKTLQQHYPPGSTYKFVVGGAALEDHLASPSEHLTCPGSHRAGGRLFYCMHTHGSVDFLDALQRSCNVYFWKLAERVGIDRMAAVATDFGFGAVTGLGLNGEVPGRVPTRAFYDDRGVHTLGHTLNTATGQGDVELTVVQLVMAYAALANGGRLYAPKVVERVESAGGEVVAEVKPELRRRIALSPATLDVIRQGMWRVVNAPGGTAHRFGRSDLVEIVGKTGTAQVHGRRPKDDAAAAPQEWDPNGDHAWFAGWAPASRPEIAIVVLIEHGGGGGAVAAPVAREIIEGYFTSVKPRRAAL
ncbi:MAG TPA: penicillin-binding protein 2 [Kofleriaceae bacterium]|nr:penicillin-binding protein 2 [Kofleriaceae bacterium]